MAGSAVRQWPSQRQYGRRAVTAALMAAGPDPRGGEGREGGGGVSQQVAEGEGGRHGERVEAIAGLQQRHQPASLPQFSEPLFI